MIKVTRINGDSIIINAELIESVQARPDTLIHLTTGNRIMVKESPESVIRKVIEYRKEVNSIDRERHPRELTEEEE